MVASIRHFVSRSTGLRYLVFGVGLVLLLSSWFVLYVWTLIGTEALLVPWGFGGTWYTPPALGTVPRTINDFFGTIGKDVPSLIFVLVSGGIVAVRMLRSSNRTWLPLVFFLANVVFLAADLLATSFSWSLSNWVVGPRIGIDTGYHRTWYGIAASGLLWIIFWVVLIKLPLEGRGKLAKPAPSASIA